MKALIVFALFALYGCATDAWASGGLRVEFWQDLDSARFVVIWSAAPQGPRQRATDYYDVQLVIDTVVASDTTSALNDTLAMAYPPLDSTVTLLARVRNVTTSGLISDWRVSSPFVFTTPELPPSPPGSITVDTLAVLLPPIVRPSIVSMMVPDTVRLCSIDLWSDGRSELSDVSKPFARCDELYARWLTERAA